DYVSIEEANLVSENDPETDWIEKEELSDLKKQILSVLSDFEADVLRLYLRGFSYKTIAEKLGKTEKSVGNALSRVKNKLRKEN
ncbi:MAG: RNA polymerase subunit sigma-70, partial [Oscillospiraceae bacterium]|nr:RNA polymerase subunit sigma-70 [Oscillospiraceae bacterium]